MKHLVNVSGGMASAVSLFRVLERFGEADAVFADVGQEHPDCYRFIDDVERVSGVAITRLGGERDCWDVWDERMMLTNMAAGGGCMASYHLKKIPLREYTAENFDPADTTIYVGFGPDEKDRGTRIEKANPEWTFDYPLQWKPKAWRCDLADDLRGRGIEPPSMYAEGYSHANCAGACILAGIS